MTKRKDWSEMVRSTTFGVQDSLVSTVGLISGVASGGMDKRNIILSGLILILVEALSMGFGELFSAEAAEETENHKEANVRRVIPSAILMFISYVVSGLVPVFPYLVWEIKTAFFWSNIFSLAGLFIYGWFYGRSVRLGRFKHALKMFVYGLIAIGCGIVAGSFLGKLG